MQFISSKKNSLSNLGYIGFAISGTKEQRHIGIAYRASVNEVMIVDLGFHRMLKNDTADDDEPWYWAEFGLDEINQEIIAKRISYLAAKHQSNRALPSDIQYGFIYNGTYFDEGDEYTRNKMGEGLTCATFVLAVFKKLGLQFLDEESWLPREEEDAEWHRRIIDLMEELKIQFSIPDGHIEALKKNIGNGVRFKPEEVAGSGVVFFNENRDDCIKYTEGSEIGKKVLCQIFD
ncbi:hypothetical protein [Microvirgula aerodenitrificans]|uniref:hypothetical protein n=1 Tax=Microvirgula aerodenitrificans TaxID=57480 RepID=UPI0012EC9F4E|nr:hypothetical protein [Microvirgula aerodenitrificans]